MGQMTFAIMLGVDASEHVDKLGEDRGWSDLFRDYDSGGGPKPDHPHGDTSSPDIIGFWVAVGASGMGGYPFLEGGFQMDRFCADPEYAASADRAQKAWGKFSRWMAGRGFALDEPQLWLVETEVA